MDKVFRKIICSGILFFSLFGYANHLEGVEISISCGAVGRELEICRSGVEAWAAMTEHRVKVVSTPNSSTERFALYRQLLSVKSPDIDILQIDIVWPGMLGAHFEDISKYIEKDILQQHFPSIIEANRVKDRLVAAPWFTDVGILYYRSDLLKKYNRPVPTTWEELERTARDIREAERKSGNKNIWGFVWQGRAYEGLTCNALEWIYSYGGGTIVAENGSITINNSKAAKSIAAAAKWIGTISPSGVLNYTEEEARSIFQSGNAVFMRNWPYAWALAQSETSPVKGKIGIAALPKGGRDGFHTGALGGWQLAISKYSEHKEIAARLIAYLTSSEEQKRRAIKGAFNPTITSLYQDKDVLAANPFFSDLHRAFSSVVARPSMVTGKRYNRVSSEFYNSVHRVLSGKKEPKAILRELEKKLKRISQNEKW